MRLDFINRVCQSRWTCTCCVGYHQFGRFRWIDANFVRTYVRGWKMGCVDGCSEEATHPPPPLLPRTTFAEKYYNMEYVGSTYGVDAVSVSVSVSAMRFIDRKDGFIHLGRLLVCQRIKLRPTGHSIPMIAVRFDYAARCVRSFSPISSGILRSLGNILPCVFYRGATIVRSGVSIG